MRLLLWDGIGLGKTEKQGHPTPSSRSPCDTTPFRSIGEVILRTMLRCGCNSDQPLLGVNIQALRYSKNDQPVDDDDDDDDDDSQ